MAVVTEVSTTTKVPCSNLPGALNKDCKLTSLTATMLTDVLLTCAVKATHEMYISDFDMNSDLLIGKVTIKYSVKYVDGGQETGEDELESNPGKDSHLDAPAKAKKSN